MAGQAEKVFVPTDAELLQAQSDLWRHSLCYLTPMALRCAVDLGVPTAIHRLGGAASPSELVATLSLPASKLPFLARLLRQLATAGVFCATDAGTYRLNPLSYLLVDGVRIDGDASQTAIVRAAASRYYVEAAMGLADWFRKDFDGAVPSPFEDVHGAAILEESMALLDPEMDQLIHDAVAAHDHMGIGPVLRQCRELFEGLESLTDCGGGDGTTARSIVEAYPHIKCTVLDLPKVMDEVPPTEGAVKYVSGDLFHVVPPAQAVLLKLVLHFWSDEDCIKILAQCKKAIPPRDAGGKVIVIDIVLGSVLGPMLETQHLMDMVMLVMTRGRQREEKDWSEIFTKAGFSGYKIVKKLGARAVIEVYP